MAEAPRITVPELRQRMEVGEDFTVIDVHNPEAWRNRMADTRSDTGAIGQARREPAKHPQGQSGRGVLYLTK